MDSKNNIILGRSVWNEDMKCVAADNNMISFLGCHAYRSILDFIPEEETQEFMAFWNELNVGAKSDIILNMKRSDGQKRLVRLHGEADLDNICRKEITLDCIDIYAATSGYRILSDENEALTGYLELSDGYFFEYCKDKEELKLFRYTKGRRIAADDTECADIIPPLRDRLEQQPENFDIINETMRIGNSIYSVKATVLYRDLMISRIFGRIRKNRERMGDLQKENISSDLLDSFTGLYNKVSALDYARKKIESADDRQILLFMIDLDNFKQVNDTYGHIFGDEVLRRMALILKEVTAGRGIASRFGGDEFMLVLENIGTESEIRFVAEAIRTRLEWAFADTKEKVRITCTVGIAEYPKNGRSFDIMFKKADRALYIGKQKGRNRYIIYREALHGEVTEQDDGNLGEGIKATLNAAQFLQGMSWCMNALCKNGSAILSSVAEKIRLMFGLDCIAIYLGNELKLSYIYGEKKEPVESLACVRKPIYLEMFDENGECHIQFKHMTTGYFDEFHGVIQNSGVNECNLVLFGTKDNFRGLISFERHQVDMAVSKKWSEEENHMLILLAKMIGSLLT